MAQSINRREAAALINSLNAGVVPRIGLRHIAVGRLPEVEAFMHDLDVVEAGGGAFRFVCGRYGSGKSFLLQMIRNNAMERGFAVMDADLSPERRLTGTKGQGLATYKELLQHLSVSARPEGGALEAVLQTWIYQLQVSEAKARGLSLRDEALVEAVSLKISEVLADLAQMSCGFAFAAAVDSYWRALKTQNDALKQAALRWLRGEYALKSDAKRELPVDVIIDDSNWYDFLKLLAVFVARAGFKGLLIFLDEGVNLYKIPHRQTRQSNYEKILTIFNDTMQGLASYIGFFMSGTPEFIDDDRRGLYSYEALRSRLMQSRFSQQGYSDLSSPVIRLSPLTPEELFLLLERLTQVHAYFYGYESTLHDEELKRFLIVCTKREGAQQLLTAREVIRDFLGLLNTLQQHPEVSFNELMEKEEQQADKGKSPAAGGQGTGRGSAAAAADEFFAEFDL